MNLGDIVIRVQRQFGDDSGVQIDRDDIVRWANDAQVDIVRETACLQSRSETAAVEEDGTYQLPNDFISIQRVTFDDRQIYPISVGEANKNYPDRDVGTNVGTPRYYWVWANILHVMPWPSASGSGNLDIWYVRAPGTLTLDENVPEIPSHMHEDMVRYCLARAKELDEEDEKAQEVWNDYRTRAVESSYLAQNPQSDAYPSVRLLPGDD